MNKLLLILAYESFPYFFCIMISWLVLKMIYEKKDNCKRYRKERTHDYKNSRMEEWKHRRRV